MSRYNTKKRSYNEDYSNTTQPAVTVQQLGLMDQLALLIHQESTRQELLYHALYDDQKEGNDLYEDIFNGQIYKDMKADGYFSNHLILRYLCLPTVFLQGLIDN